MYVSGSSRDAEKTGSTFEESGNRISFQYCYSWGYQKVYQQFAGILQQELGHEYSDLLISGENYNPGGGRVQIAQLLGVCKMLVIGCLMFSFNPWTYFGEETLGRCPSLVIWALENKIYACMMVFFLSNMVETQLISSGAFEVTVNGVRVWSKLETGGTPQPGTLLTLVRDKLKQHSNRITENIKNQLWSENLTLTSKLCHICSEWRLDFKFSERSKLSIKLQIHEQSQSKIISFCNKLSNQSDVVLMSGKHQQQPEERKTFINHRNCL